MAFPLATAIGTGTGVLTGLASQLFSGESEQDKALKDIIARIKGLQGYSEQEMERSVSDFSKAGNVSVLSLANTLAYSGSKRQNLLNTATANLVPQVAFEGIKQKYNMLAYNKGLEQNKLSMELSAIQGLDDSTAQEDFFATLGLGLQGGQIGTQIDDLLKYDPTKKLTQENELLLRNLRI